MSIVRSILLFVLAAIAEIGGVWQGVREHRGLVWVGAWIAALGAYGIGDRPPAGTGGLTP